MNERNVDVMNKAGEVLHTYPIKLGDANSSPIAADYEKAALAAAATAKLVSEADQPDLTARMHAHSPTKN